MKVLVVGGYAPSLVNFRGHLLQSLVDGGHEVHAAAPGLIADTVTEQRLRGMRVNTHDVTLRRTGTNIFADIASLWSLVAIIRAISPQVILTYTIKPVIWGTIAATFAGVPHRFALVTGLGYAFTGTLAGKRRLVNGIVRFLYWASLKRVQKVFFQNSDDEALFRKLGLLPDNIPSAVVNGSGVDTEHFAPKPLPAGAPSFLLIARLLKDKGICEFACAAEIVRQKYPEVSFNLVGPTDSNPDVVSMEELDEWQRKGILTWHGEQADVRQAIACSHVYVLPSYREGTPRTVLEAMAMGRPVITTDAPGCRETVEEGRNGLLVPPRCSKLLAAAMMKFIENPQLIAEMGRQSRRIAEDKYDVRKVNAMILREMDLA